MPEIIPNSEKYLKISQQVYSRQEPFVVYLRERRNRQLTILGLKEWLKSRGNQRKKGLQGTVENYET